MRLPGVVRGLVARLSGETRAFAKDSSILTVAAGLTTVGQMLQIVLITHLLGLHEYGVFAIVVGAVAIVARFFDVQVGDAMIAFAAEKLRRDPKGTTGVVQLAYAIDFIAGIAGFVVVAGLFAPLFGDDLIGADGQTLMTVYGLTLLAATVDNTSLALLRLMGRFQLILRLTAFREVLRFALLGAVLFSGGSLLGALVALVAVETVMGVVVAALAFRTVQADLGMRLTDRRHFAPREERRGLLGMVFHTNFVSYSKIAVSQGPALFLGAFHGPVQAGLFKIGMSVAFALGKLTDPAWAAVMPRLARLWNADRGDEIRRLLYQSTLIAFGVTATVGLAVGLARGPILVVIGGEEAKAAGAVLVLGLVAKIINGTFFWNAAALYAAKQARTASRIYLTGAAVFIPTLAILSYRYGANGAAAAYVVWSVQVNAGLTIYATRRLGLRGRRAAPRAAAT